MDKKFCLRNRKLGVRPSPKAPTFPDVPNQQRGFSHKEVVNQGSTDHRDQIFSLCFLFVDV